MREHLNKRVEYFGMDGMAIGLLVMVISLPVTTGIKSIEHFEVIKELMDTLIASAVAALLTMVTFGIWKAVLKEQAASVFMTVAVGFYIFSIMLFGVSDLSDMSYRGSVRKMRIYNVKCIFPSAILFSTKLREF
ncbi:hypothetical protein AAV35_013750 (plasmid) [Salimicrobium jeotgali]|uniref:Uncharacterized protein n=1 Tax=Salimicrobium jeotgali TaxID=1230341 RepID=K2G6H8_9BACI|nr:hypothetical protein [Salimicrobium jeotgali]AKG05844.1 hypothetical protein AAV35_013750 [Salimicrobium jeotgali]EKE30793.1 hypothetical protein MJ3_11765 [Salimicrobium jeotgali]MBM7697609.1 hypothetical protein [Salimicrobium jeotgali]